MTNTQTTKNKLHRIALTEQLEESEKQLIVSKGHTASHQLVEGKLLSYRYSDAISLHGGKSLELVNSEIVSTIPKTITILILLKGKLKFGFDDLNFDLNAFSKPLGTVVNIARPANFHRSLIFDNHITKLNITIHPSWFEKRAIDGDQFLNFISCHKNHLMLTITSEMVSLTHQIIDLGTPSELMDKLKLETLTHQLITEVLLQIEQATLISHSEAPPSPQLSMDDVISYLETHLQENLTLEHIADKFSMSVSNLQRRFKKEFDITINGYMRQRRLEIAKQNLERGVMTITEAAYESGYNHPSNFTNAFKRAFGVAPQHVAKR